MSIDESPERLELPVWPLGLVAIVLFGVACAAPAVFIDAPPPTSHMSFSLGGTHIGARALLFGQISSPIAWLANPVWLFGLIGLFRGRPAIARNCGGLAVVLGLATLVSIPPQPSTALMAGLILALVAMIGVGVWLAAAAGPFRGRPAAARGCGLVAFALGLVNLAALFWGGVGGGLVPIGGSLWFVTALLLLVALIGLLRGEEETARDWGLAALAFHLASLGLMAPVILGFAMTPIRPLSGFYYWQASFACLAVAGILGVRNAGQPAKPKPKIVDELA